MSIDSFKLKEEAFEKALNQLEKALKQPKSEYMRDAVIQRFEFTYELAWKTIKAYLSTLDLTVLSPKDALKIAYQQGLITDAAAWSELHVKRNLTSHTYDEILADEIYGYLQKEGLSLFLSLQQTLRQFI